MGDSASKDSAALSFVSGVDPKLMGERYGGMGEKAQEFVRS